MNGINYSSLFANTNMFGQTKTIKDEKNSSIKGKMIGTGVTKQPEKQELQDTVELNSSAGRLKKASYERPVRKATSKTEGMSVKEQDYKLSDQAQKLLEELKEKYGNMEFRVAKWSSDAEEDYYASKCEKDFSVLIDPDALEAMAADENVRAQYESILENAAGTSEKLKEELGEDADQVQNFTVSIDRDGKVTYTLQLIEDFSKRNAENAAKQKEALEESREERVKENRIHANSLDELIEKVKKRLTEMNE